MNRCLCYPVRLALILTMAVGLYLPAWSAFDMERSGARPSGMGGAFCALADDADALNYNPAGLARIFSTTLSFNYVKLLSGLDDGALADSRIAFLQPLNQIGTLGISWYQRSLADLYQENMVNLACGFPLDNKGDILLGGALKILHLAYLDTEAVGQNSYFNYSTSVAGCGFDLGGLMRITDHLSVGLSWLNFNQPNLSLFESAESQIPMQFRMGGAYQQDKYTGVLECLWRGQDFRFSAGGEAWWFERLLGTRLGIGLGDRGMAELTAGLSFHRQTAGGWGWQIDYAFINPVGDFAGLGLTHQINCSVYFGTEPKDKEVLQAKKLVKAGELSRSQGKLEKALETWEQAAKVLPKDWSLAFRINALKIEIRDAVKVKRYFRHGRNFEKGKNYLNAAKEYRKILALVPGQVEAVRRLRVVKAKIQKMSQSQKMLAEKKEKKAARYVREQNERKAKVVLRKAQRSLARAEKKGDIRKKNASELKRLTKQLQKARALLEEGESEQARVLARAIVAETEKLIRQAPRKVKKTERKKKKQTVFTKPKAKVASSKGVGQAATILSEKQKADNERLRKRARGAYGRTVKLMLEIDKLNGKKYFPAEYLLLKRELGRIKVLLKNKDYPKTISNAKEMFRKLKKFKQECAAKDKVRKAMPTNW